MDTIACASAIIALGAQIITSERVMTALRGAPSPRPDWAAAAVIAAAAAAILLGILGYHKKWPAWANGRAVFAIGAGAVVAIVTILDALGRSPASR